MRIAIVEDESASADHLCRLVRQCLGAEGSACAIECYSSSGAFLEAHRLGAFDLLLLDCVLDCRDSRSGIDVLREVRRRGDTTPCVLVTSSREYAIDGYELDVRGYLVKPVNAERLAATLERIGLRGRTQPRLVASPAGGPSVDANAMMHCCARGHYVVFHMIGGSEERMRIAFSEVQRQVGDDTQFFSCMRGCLVNLSYVTMIDGADYVLADGSRVPISRRLAREARELLAAYRFGRMRGER